MTLASRPVRAAARAAGALAAAAGAGLVAGALTSWLQGVLPADANWLANSGAAWTVVAYLAALAVVGVVRTPPAAVAAGVLALVGEVAGYYALASSLRGIATSPAERVLWTAAALVIGPAVGWAAHLTRADGSAAHAAALAAVGGVIGGEGLHALWRLDAPVQGWTELTVAAAVAATGVIGGDPVRRLAAAVPTAVAVGAVVLVAYGT